MKKRILPASLALIMIVALVSGNVTVNVADTLVKITVNNVEVESDVDAYVNDDNRTMWLD
jgi:hypothetical protein